jgi:hypothetical protein
MRITNLRLQNFRSHRDTSFEFARVNIIRGRNGAGKSSIAMALEQLLTGKCDITDQAGRGAQALISSGAVELLIEATLAKPPHTLLPMSYRRNITSGQLVIGPHAGTSAFEWLEANLVPISVLSSVLNAHRFLGMNAKEQKALLAGALAADPVPIDPEIRALHAEIAAGFPMQEAVVSAEHVDRLYDWHFKQRTNTNREIKSLGELAAPEEPQEKHSLAEVRTMITELQKQRDHKYQERLTMLAGHKGKVDRLAAAKAQKALYEADLLESDQLEQCRKDAKNSGKVTKLKEDIARRQLDLDELRREFERVRNCKQEEACPTCGQAIPGKDEIDDGWLEKVQTSIAVQTAELTEKQAELRKLPDPSVAQEKIDRHQLAMSPYNKAEMTISEIGELGDAPNVSDLDAEIVELDRRISAGNSVADEVSKYEGARAQHQRQVEKVNKLNNLSAGLDRLVEYFSDRGGLKAKLINGKLPAFRDRINQVLYRFGFECEFELDPYVLSVIQLDSNGGMLTKPLALQQLSESEQYRFSIAFSIALAETTGVNLVVIDRSDMLSADARSELAGILMESSLDQAFVLCSSEPAPTPEIPDVKFFYIENRDGSTELAGCVEEEAHANQ